MTRPSAGETHWNKPSESRFCGRSAKPIGLSEALVERQLAWASRGRHWHTRWISWESLGLPSEAVPKSLSSGLLHSPREKATDVCEIRRVGTEGHSPDASNTCASRKLRRRE